MKSFILLFCFISSLTLAGTLLPENSLNIPVDSVLAKGISEEDFNAVLEELKAIYTPMAKSQGATLTFVGSWKDGTVNAYAQRRGEEDEDGQMHPPFNDWRVVFLGGLARHKFTTRDGFSLVVCHELGHHFGGTPIYDGEMSWASVEGQADYFATTKCLRRLWQGHDNAKAIEGQEIPDTLKVACFSQWTHPEDQNLCLRIGLAGQSIGNLFGSLVTFGRLPKFDTPDKTIAPKTVMIHPKAQCRLDTFFQGTLCEISYTQEFGKNGDELTGACHAKNGQTVGFRPACWFKAQD